MSMAHWVVATHSMHSCKFASHAFYSDTVYSIEAPTMVQKREQPFRAGQRQQRGQKLTCN